MRKKIVRTMALVSAGMLMLAQPDWWNNHYEIHEISYDG